jgi:hypothetical protein
VPVPPFCDSVEEDVAIALNRARASSRRATRPSMSRSSTPPDTARLPAHRASRGLVVSRASPGTPQAELLPGVRLRLKGSIRARGRLSPRARTRNALQVRWTRPRRMRRPAAADADSRAPLARYHRSRRTPEPVRAAMLRLTQLFNLTGHPSVALPAGPGRDGLPRSLQLVGPRHATERLLAVAAAVERQISGGPGSVGGGTG